MSHCSILTIRGSLFLGHLRAQYQDRITCLKEASRCASQAPKNIHRLQLYQLLPFVIQGAWQQWQGGALCALPAALQREQPPRDHQRAGEGYRIPTLAGKSVIACS